MVGRYGEVYVMDWGLAKVRGREGHDLRLRMDSATSIRTLRRDAESHHETPIMTMDGAVLGTPAYMPPEQAGGHVHAVDERSDVYAIGAMLYQLLTGQPPYVPAGAAMSPRTVLAAVVQGPPAPIHAISPETPAELEAIARRLGLESEKAQEILDARV